MCATMPIIAGKSPRTRKTDVESEFLATASPCWDNRGKTESSDESRIVVEPGIPTMVTPFQRGPREALNENPPGTHGDVGKLCKAGQWKEALHILNQGCILADHDTYVCLLKECIKIKSLADGKQVHAHIIKTGFKSNTLLLRTLVDMYAKCGRLVDARLVFDNMPERDVITWTIMVGGYAKQGCGREALQIFEQMIREGVTPNKVTFICALKACGSVGALVKGKEIHANIIKAGLAPDTILETALAAMYANCGSMKDAQRVFDTMSQRNVVSWNVMIGGYTRNQCGTEAFKIYEKMIQEGVIADKVTFICVLNACASLEALEKGKEVHSNIIKARVAPDIILENTIIAMYAKCGSINDARQVFTNMVKRDVVSWNAMIAGHAQHGFSREALNMYEQMRQEGVMPDKVTFICIINVCARLAALEKGKEVHAVILKVGIAPDIILETALVDMYAKCRNMKDAHQVFDSMAEWNVVSWNAMIAGYAQHGCIGEALQLFEQMQQEGFKPNVVSWSAMITGYARHGFGTEAVEMYEQMIKGGVEPDKVTFICILSACASLAALEKGKEVHMDIMKAGIASYINLENSLVDMYAKCGSVEEARQVFNNMAHRNVVSWNVMIAGYGQQGCGWEALQLFEQMQQEGLKPNCITFICLLSTCSHLGLVSEGRHYFDSMMQDHGLTPTVEHFGCMVDLLGRAGRLDEAEDFISNMPIKPGPSVWGALLGACRAHGEVAIGERAAKCLLLWDPLHAPTYVLLSNIYAAAGRWDDTAKVRKLMQDRAVIKDPGRIRKPSGTDIQLQKRIFTEPGELLH